MNKHLSEVINEDCMEGMARYPDKYFDLAIVDPPYGIGEANGKNNSRNKGFGKGNLKSKKITYSKDYGVKDWDNKKPESKYFMELKRISKNQIIWGANHFIENIPNANSSCWIVWDKNNNGDFADAELAYTSFKTAVRKIKLTWSGFIKCEPTERFHPTQKPIKLYKWLLHNYAKQGDKIIDTHLGSGSSRIAAYDMGFDFTAFELDKEYFEAQEKRFNQFKSQLKLF
jgi:site-specific DNA-methyltransferase (adenine-specific)